MATTESMNDERGAFRKAWDRLTAGNIDDTGSEAAMRYKNADGSLRDERKTDAELLADAAPAPEVTEGPTDADVPVDKTDSTASKMDEAKAEIEPGFTDQYFDAPEPMPAPVAKPVVKAPSKPAVKAAPKPAVVAPSAESQVPAPMADKAVKKTLRYEPMAERGKGFSYAGAQAEYDAANPDEVDEVDELDKPNAFGAKYSMPKSLAEQIRMIWQGKDYKPSASVKVKARPVAASQVDKIPR